MTRNVNKIITSVLAGIFIVSFMLPTLQGPMGVKLSGLTTFGLHIASVNFIENATDYMIFLFTALTNVWVIVLLFWSYRKKVRLLPTILLSSLALISALSWKFNMQESGVLLIGYWVWVLSIVLIGGFDVYKAIKRPNH